MKLEPPFTQYLEGDPPSHTSFARLGKYAKAWPQDEIARLLLKGGFLKDDGKPSRYAAEKGLIDICEGRVLWNLLETKRALIGHAKLEEQAKARAEQQRLQREQSTGPKWVDLGTIGTYFGASNIVVGKWLDQLGLRGIPKLEVNESGDVDMLDIARQAQQKQITGFLGKEPTELAIDRNIAQKITVMGRKQKEITIVQWNLELCKQVLIRAGHPLDTERKLLLKGKGKNSDVKVITIDDRAKELYSKWKKLKAEGKGREADKLFEKQPDIILTKIEILMNRPGSLTQKK